MSQRSIIFFLCILLVYLVDGTESRSHFSPRKGLTAARTHSPKKEAVLLQEDGHTVLTSRGGGLSQQDNKALSGAAVFLIMDTAFRKIFRACEIKFPPQLGGCIVLFAFMLLSEIVMPGTGDKIFQTLSPGATFLTKWLPVFFVPGLAMLPLAPSIGSAFDHILVLSVVVLGFYYSSSTVAYGVGLMRRGKFIDTTPGIQKGKNTSTPAPSQPAKPFLDSTSALLLKTTFVSGVASLVATRSNFKYSSTLQAVFHFVATLAAYVWGALLPSGFTKFVHPLVTGTFLTWIIMQVTAVATGSTFNAILKEYKVGSLHWSDSGAGDQLLNLLGPSVISFAIAMYSRKGLLIENLAVVLTSMLISAGGGLFGTAAFVRAINLGGSNGSLVRLSVLARNITTALGIAVTQILNGNVSIAASVIVLTGIFAATFGRSILDSYGLEDPVARGLAIGSAGQGLGVASMSVEPDAFPFAAMAMVLTAVCATTLVSIPAVKDAIVSLATGS